MNASWPKLRGSAVLLCVSGAAVAHVEGQVALERIDIRDSSAANLRFPAIDHNGAVVWVVKPTGGTGEIWVAPYDPEQDMGGGFVPFKAVHFGQGTTRGSITVGNGNTVPGLNTEFFPPVPQAVGGAVPSIAFISSLSGIQKSGAVPEGALLRHPDGSIDIIAAGGDPVQSSNSNQFIYFFDFDSHGGSLATDEDPDRTIPEHKISLNSNGKLGIYAGITSSMPNEGTSAVWVAGAGSPPTNLEAGKIFFANDALDGVKVNRAPSPSITNTQAVFLGKIHGVPEYAVFSSNLSVSPPSTVVVAKPGDAAPGLPGMSYGAFHFAPGVNDLGTVVYSAQLQDSAGVLTDYSLWAWESSAGALLLAKSGDLVEGVALSSFGDPIISDGDRVAVAATLQGADVTSANDSAILLVDLDRDGNTNNIVGVTRGIVAKEGDPAPLHEGAGTVVGTFSVPSGSTAVSPFQDPFVNGANDIAFLAQYENNGVAGKGVWIMNSLNDCMYNVVHTGQQLPDGVVTDVGFVSQKSSLNTGNMQMSGSGNDDGRRSGISEQQGFDQMHNRFFQRSVAFWVKLDAGGVTKEAIYAGGSPCEFDVDGGGGVGPSDLLAVLARFNMSCQPGVCCPADLNGDGIVDNGDLDIITERFGVICP